MKKNAGLPALVFLSLVLFISPGCEKENETSYPTIEVSVSEHDIDYGGTVTISWVSNNDNEVKLNNESVNSSGSTSVTLYETTNFSFTVSNTKGTARQTETISVRAEVFAPTLNLIFPDSIAWNQTETISYSSTGVTKLTINGQFAPVNGEYVTEKGLDEPVHIVFAAEGPKGTLTKEVTIPVKSKTKLDYITAFGSWKIDSEWSIFEEGGEWTKRNLGESANYEYYFFPYSSMGYSPYYYEVFDASKIRIGNGSWSLFEDNTKFNLGGFIPSNPDAGNYTIDIINETTFQITGVIDCIGEGCWQPTLPYRRVYKKN